jgi:hypothetical protein
MIELPLLVALCLQDANPKPTAAPPATDAPAPPPVPAPAEVDAAIAKARDLLLPRQETMKDGAPKAEWPYEGVYRVGGKIPYGYRVGGTGIVRGRSSRSPATPTTASGKKRSRGRRPSSARRSASRS